MSSHSPRSKRIRQEAHNRPDKVWLEVGQWTAKKYENPTTSSSVLSGGAELTQLIAEADSHLAAMRKVVQ